MSNYNSTLQSNNTDLQAILNTINELPEAGTAIETCTVKVNSNTSSYRFDTIGYTTVDSDGNLSAETVKVSANTTTIENVVCGSMLACMKGQGLASATVGVVKIYSNTSYGCIFKITASAGQIAIISVGGSGGSN